MKLHGAFFTGTTGVNFDAVPAVFSVVNDALIQCTPPAQADSVTNVEITVLHPKGNWPSEGTAYYYPPRVDGISPSSGSQTGGTSITVTGAHFRAGATVALSGSLCTSVVVVNATTITCVTPSHTVGAKTCRVTNPDGKFGDKLNAFTYTAATPALTSLNFDLADKAGGTPITITGTDLGSATGCTVGGTSASITANTSTSLTFTMPAKTAGSYNVQVTTSAGSSNTLSIEAWSPDQITGIDSYFDSRKGVSLSGSDVTTWTEQSRSAAYTGGLGNRPTRVATVFGSSPAIRFSPQQWVVGTRRALASGLSYFWVGKWTSSDTTQGHPANPPLTVVGDDHSGTYGAGGASGGALSYVHYNAGYQNTTRGSGLNDGSARLCGWTHNSASGDIKAYVGTTQQGSTANVAYATATFSYTSVGVGWGPSVDGFDGDLGAVIVVSGVISAGDMTKLHKWARAEFAALP
jgi:hypothetical protein